MLEHIKNFIGDIIISGCVAQISTLNHVLGIAKSDADVSSIVSQNQSKDLYILGGVNPEKDGRAADDDVLQKNYFFLDFDIRNYYLKKNNADVSDQEIKNLGGYITEKLSAHEHLQNWRYMIYTGNGIHVYYFGDPCKIENKVWWSDGVDLLMQDAYKITGIEPDTGCKNVGRISRLPTSYNNKNGAHKLVEFLAYQDKKFPIEIIQKLGKDRQDARQKEQPHQDFNPEKPHDLINEIPIAQIVSELTGWRVDRDGRHFLGHDSTKRKACFVSDKGNFLVHGGTDHLPQNMDGFSPFEFVRHQLNLSAAETFNWFNKKYPHVMAATKRERVMKKQTSFPFVGLDKMVEYSAEYLDNLDPNTIFEYGYKPLDDHLGGIYPSEVVLIGGESGTGKTSFLTSVLKHNAQRCKALFFSLEDTLNDYTLKQIWFALGRIRKERGDKNYPWRDFRNNLVEDYRYHEDRKKAESIVRKDENLFFYDRGHEDAPDKMDIDTLEELTDKAAKKGFKLIGIDHLHFFNLNEVGQTKADRLEQVMQRIKGMAERNDVAIVLLAHYKKLFGDKPSLDSFKDSSAIVQTANVVINMWRDRSDDLGTDINETHFMMPKVRSPVGEKTIIMQFNPHTFEYEYKDESSGTAQGLSKRKEIELIKKKKGGLDGSGAKAPDLPF